MTAQPIKPALFDFLRELKANNERPWFEANKARYRAEVRDPMLDFIQAFAEPLVEISPYFRADPRPNGGSLFRIYQRHAVLEGQDALQDQCRRALPPRSGQGRPRARLLSAFGARHVLRRLRRLASGRRHAREDSRRGRGTTGGMDAHHRVRCLLPDLSRLAGEALKRPPRGYDPEHPLIEDLKRKDFVAITDIPEAEAIRPDFLDRFATVARAGAEINSLPVQGRRRPVLGARPPLPYSPFGGVAAGLGVPWGNSGTPSGNLIQGCLLSLQTTRAGSTKPGSAKQPTATPRCSGRSSAVQ